MQNPLLDFIKPYAPRDLDAMRELIGAEGGKSIDINVQESSGTTVLHWAVRRWYIDLARLVLERGADINIQDVEGDSSLHLVSIAGGNVSLFELLL